MLTPFGSLTETATKIALGSRGVVTAQ